MKYSAILAASAALALASPQAKVPKAAAECPTQCGPDERIQTECQNQSRCMCDKSFFAAWTECRQCLYGPGFDTDPNYALNKKGIDSVSARICAPSATESFQPVWSEVANSLGIFDAGVGAPAPAAATATSASAGAAGAAAATVVRASASAVASASAGGSGGSAADRAGLANSSPSGGASSGAASSARAGAAGAAATTTRAAGSASPSSGVAAGRGGNSTSPVAPNAGNSGKVVSGLAAAAVGAAAILAL